MAKQFKQQRAKRANKPNPRQDRNFPDFLTRPDSRFFDNTSDPRLSSPQQQGTRAKKRAELVPRNISQETYVDALQDENQSIIFAMGPAGCGKTLLATTYAIMALQQRLIDKIIITRPAVSVDEQHGFLPGDITAKLSPWVIPVIDVFKEHYSPAQVEKMLLDEVIEIAPLAYMRGRTFKNTIILADEMQNATPNQMKMVLTRIGVGCRMVVTGDLAQHDRGFEQNGLKDFVERLESTGSQSMTICRFGKGDIERHAIIEEVLRLYGDE